MNKHQKPQHQWSKFTMVPTALIYYNNYVPRECSIKGIEQLTLIHLMSYAYGSTVVFPSQERLANDIGVSRKSIGRHIKTLVDKGWLLKQSNGHKANNSYDIHPALQRLTRVDQMLSTGNVTKEHLERTQESLNDNPDNFWRVTIFIT